MTEDEKKEQLAKIEAKLRQKRLEREAREKEEALQRERNRIKSGNNSSISCDVFLTIISCRQGNVGSEKET